MTVQATYNSPADVSSPIAETGSMTRASNDFRKVGNNLIYQEQKLRDDMKSDTSNASKLADYQAAVSELAIYHNARSSTVKALKDMASSVVANFR